MMRVNVGLTQLSPLSFKLLRYSLGGLCYDTPISNHFSTSGCGCAKELIPSSSELTPSTSKPPSLVGWVKNNANEIKEFFLARRKLADRISMPELTNAAYITYEEVVEMICVEEFFYDFNMPDTFASWFTVVELHLWLISARIMREETIGYHARDMLTEAFFEDVNYRSSLLGPRASLYRKKQIAMLGYQFTAAYYGYDEGVQSSDKVLAAILWRRFFGFECDDATQIERLVKYIRVQLDHLSNISFEDIMFKRKDLFIPLSTIRVD